MDLGMFFIPHPQPTPGKQPIEAWFHHKTQLFQATALFRVARTEHLSITACDQSICPAAPSSSHSTSQIFCHTPACCQSRSRLTHSNGYFSNTGETGKYRFCKSLYVRYKPGRR
jgi:hypothetical protein